MGWPDITSRRFIVRREDPGGGPWLGNLTGHGSLPGLARTMKYDTDLGLGLLAISFAVMMRSYSVSVPWSLSYAFELPFCDYDLEP